MLNDFLFCKISIFFSSLSLYACTFLLLALSLYQPHSITNGNLLQCSTIQSKIQIQNTYPLAFMVFILCNSLKFHIVWLLNFFFSSFISSFFFVIQMHDSRKFASQLSIAIWYKYVKSAKKFKMLHRFNGLTVNVVQLQKVSE